MLDMRIDVRPAPENAMNKVGIMQKEVTIKMRWRRTKKAASTAIVA
jgi:hypothetical protein